MNWKSFLQLGDHKTESDDSKAGANTAEAGLPKSELVPPETAGGATEQQSSAV